jgi:hypothetical protein
LAALTGFSAGVSVFVNGQPVSTASVNDIGGQPGVIAPLDDQPLPTGALSGEQLDALKAERAAFYGADPLTTFIQRWWLARAFPSAPAEALATVFPPEDGPVDLGASYPGGIDGAAVTWVRRDPDAPAFGTGEVDLGGGSNRVAYAYTTLVSDEDRDVVFLAGSDDGIKVWVNGEEVWRNNAFRPVVPDDDRFPVRLKAGDNTVLLKITQGGGGWGFCLRVTDLDGRPLIAGPLDVKE